MESKLLEESGLTEDEGGGGGGGSEGGVLLLWGWEKFFISSEMRLQKWVAAREWRE